MKRSACAIVFLVVGGSATSAEKVVIDRAVDRAVHALKLLQKADGSWIYGGQPGGSTALVGLALMECGERRDDRSLQFAAAFVREAAIKSTQTYTLALSLLFLDRYGDAADEPLIESLALRLAAGQGQSGAWTYNCPALPLEDQQRLLLTFVQQRELITKRRSSTDEDSKKAKPKPLLNAREFIAKAQLLQVGNGQAGISLAGDNSNTQFAMLATWVARRRGYPVDDCLRGVDRYFRETQNSDGGWSYVYVNRFAPGVIGSTATMTCAGLLGLAIGHGVRLEKEDGKKGKVVIDPSQDKAMEIGLLALSQYIGMPVQKGFAFNPPAASGMIQGKLFYFMWSLERVAVTMNLETIGKKDWFGWGSDLLVLNQGPDGLWKGDYGEGGVDTAFALLFLRKANFASDLSASLKGRLRDPGQRTLRAGGLSGDLQPAVKAPTPDGNPKPAPNTKAEAPAKPMPLSPVPDTPAGKLAAALIQMDFPHQTEEIERLGTQKGADHTEALATAIPHLGQEQRNKAREVLAQRLARMKPDTVTGYLADELPEIRRAASLACAMKDMKSAIPELIKLIGDRETTVSRAALASLKEMTKKDFGPTADADDAGKEAAIERWESWWKKRHPN